MYSCLVHACYYHAAALRRVEEGGRHLNQHVVSFRSPPHFTLKSATPFDPARTWNGLCGVRSLGRLFWEVITRVWWGFLFSWGCGARTIASCHVGWKWLAVKMTSGRLAMALPRPVHQPLWLSIPVLPPAKPPPPSPPPHHRTVVLKSKWVKPAENKITWCDFTYIFFPCTFQQI